MLLKPFFKKHFFLLSISLLSLSSYSQVIENENNPFVVGLFLNTIDDSGNVFGNLFNFNENYHFKRPFKITGEKRFAEDYGLELALTSNVYEEGKRFNNDIIEEDINFFSVDLAFKYYVTNHIYNKYRNYVEGYLLSGLGQNFYDGDGNTTFNLGGGLNVALTKKIRIVAQATGRIDLSGRLERSNFVQYDIGLIYRIPTKIKFLWK